MLSPQVLISISQWLTIILGISFIIFGFLGALINLLVFSSRGLRKISSSQYILVQSIIDIIAISFTISAQVILNGFAWPYLFNYRFVCILRNFFGTSSTQISLYLKCLIIFDVWSSTSRHASIRQWNSVKRARYLILITVIFWMLHTTPYLFLSDVLFSRNIWQCVLTSPQLLFYHAYIFVPCLTLFIPLMLFIFFGYYSYKNVASLQNNRRTIQLQRQFFRMILTQVLVTLISFVPYTLQLTYSTITTYWVKDAQWLATDNVIVQISRMCFYINNVIECYLYMMCSSEVRLTFKQVILKWELVHRNHRVTAFISTLPGTNTRS